MSHAFHILTLLNRYALLNNVQDHKASCSQLKFIAEIITIINRKLAKFTADVRINVAIAKNRLYLFR